MEIKIQFFGILTIYDIFPFGVHPYMFSGGTTMDLLVDLTTQYGTQMREALFDERAGGLDPTIQVQINGKYMNSNELFSQKIKPGDKIVFQRLLMGG
jgi:hypothetical protein